MATLANKLVYIDRRTDRLDVDGQPLPFYVGMGDRNRVSKKSRDHNSHHSRIVEKLSRTGFESVRTIFASGLTEENAHSIERWLIADLRSRGVKLCNMTDGGDGCSGRPMSESNKEKLKAANRGLVRSPEVRARISAAKRGRKLSDEHRAKLSVAQKLRKRTPEEAEKTAAKNRGRKNSEETKQRIRMALTGKTLPAETRAKLSDATRAQWAKQRAAGIGGALRAI